MNENGQGCPRGEQGYAGPAGAIGVPGPIGPRGMPGPYCASSELSLEGVRTVLLRWMPTCRGWSRR